MVSGTYASGEMVLGTYADDEMVDNPAGPG